MARQGVVGIPLDGRARCAPGQALDKAGDHLEAANLLEQVLADHERVLGADHPETLISRGNIGVAKLALADHHEAAEILQ